LLHILDANVLITANNHYYSIARIPEFWDWLQHMAANNRIKMPVEIYEEITEDEHGLGEWATSDEVKKVLVLQETVGIATVRDVVKIGYAPDLTEAEIEEIGRDPFLIAYALADKPNRMLVTAEGSKPTTKRQNRRVPDVCKDLGVPCCDIFGMTKTLDFRTDWKKKLPA
jgi:hypothetical protein